MIISDNWEEDCELHSSNEYGLMGRHGCNEDVLAIIKVKSKATSRMVLLITQLNTWYEVMV